MINLASYEQSRLEFFKERKLKCERKLHRWRKQKPCKKYDIVTIREKCFYYRQAVVFYRDAIREFGGKVEVEIEETLDRINEHAMDLVVGEIEDLVIRGRADG